MSLVSTPSCGLVMLRAPLDTCDYVLNITTDDKQYVQIHCHKCVLKCHSKRLNDLMTGERFHESTIKVPKGYSGAFIELVQYMYLRDLTVISDRDKVKKLCAMLDMPYDIFIISKNKLRPINTYHSIQFNIVSDDSTCVGVFDFMQHVEFRNAKLVAKAKQ